MWICSSVAVDSFALVNIDLVDKLSYDFCGKLSYFCVLADNFQEAVNVARGVIVSSDKSTKFVDSVFKSLLLRFVIRSHFAKTLVRDFAIKIIRVKTIKIQRQIF